MGTKLIEKSLGGGLKHRVVRINYSELDAAGATESVNLGSALPTGAEVVLCWYDLVTVFTADTVTGLTCQVGVTADTDAFVTAGELLSGPPTAGRRHVKGAWITASGAQLKALFTATGANLGDGAGDSDLTAGVVDVHIVYLVAKDA